MMDDVLEKSVLLPCDRERAFSLFTGEIGAWWPPERRHTGDAESAIVVAETGRFYEKARDGREVELGRVRAWEPPERLLLDWYPGTDREHPTEVEVRFVAEGDGTRVSVTHRPTAASAGLWRARVERYERSWDLVLGALRRAAEEGLARW